MKKIVKFRKEGDSPSPVVYCVNEDIDIEDVTREYGEAYDTLLLCGDNGTVEAIATWPSGYKRYQYSIGVEISFYEQEYWQDALKHII